MPLLEQVLKSYPDKVKLVIKHFPLQMHKEAREAAAASLAAHRQGKFWEFQDQLFDNLRKLSDEKFLEIARQLNLDQDRFVREMNGPEITAKINHDLQDGRQAGVKGTPAIFVNGRRLKQRSLQGFSVLIDKELARIKELNGK